MDSKTPERNQPEKNPKIPVNWKFPKRDEHGLQVLQIDSNERFLAVQRPKNIQDSNITHPLYGGEECFFNKDGERVAFRSHGKVETHIALRGGELPMEFTLPLGAPESYSSLLWIGFGTESLASARYNKGVLGVAHLERLFIERGLDRVPIKSPRLMFGSYNLEDREGTYDLGETTPDNSFAIEEIAGKNEAIILDSKQQGIFRLVWKQESVEQGRQEKVLTLIVSQTHLPSGIVKVLRSPLRVNYGKVREIALSKPPYPKDEKGRLVVPWRSIDRVVGATLSYSYPPLPPPAPQK